VESALREGGRAEGLRLIETMRRGPAGVALWPLHHARLTASAQALGWAVPATAPPAGGAARLRLTLSAVGETVWQEAALPARTGRWRVGLAAERLASEDPWLGVKSTRRGAYDRARSALTDRDEAIFLNERNEVCDGSITTVFFDRGQGMRTPPRSCGLLPGVLRAALACPEEVLHIRDLGTVRLWVGNAVRGLIPADYAP
jgi:4-amino-4-deoxychorismate lyase